MSNWGHTKRPTSDHSRAVRTMVGNLLVDAGFGNWNFRWDRSSSVVASMSRSFLATGGRGYMQLCPELIERYTLAELRQIALRLMIAIRAGNSEAVEHWRAPRVPMPLVASDDDGAPSPDDANQVMLDVAS